MEIQKSINKYEKVEKLYVAVKETMVQ